VPSDRAAALVLVDVLNGFFHPDGAMWYEGVERVVPALGRLLSTARGSGALVVHAADRHRPDVVDREFSVIPEHLPRGGFDADFYAGFEPIGSEPVVEKRRYSAFFATDLALLLHEHGIETIVVAGVKTNVCIRATATDGFAHGFTVVIPREATNSNRPHLEEASIEDMTRYIARVVPIDEAVALL
jgi:nicotinamidase-related amidase